MSIRVGTDCSGIEAPIHALLRLGIPFDHVFSSDIDMYCIKSIKANYNPELIFGDKEGSFPEGDITCRDVNDVPDIDLYIAGFPCQPFSQAGERKGFSDKRGTVFQSCLDVIEAKRPRWFILENVKGILTNDKGKTWKAIWDSIVHLEDYTVQYKMLNTRDYGIPQNRERVYMVGVRKGERDFNWPEKFKTSLTVHECIDWEDTTPSNSVCKKLRLLPADRAFVEKDFLCYTTFPKSWEYSPCVLARSSLWCTPLARFANCNEYRKLQGFSDSFRQVVSDSQFKKQLGNSMSVNVVTAILKELTAIIS